MKAGGKGMIDIWFTKEEVERLREEQYNHPHPHVQRKMEALLLKSYRLSHEKIGKIIGVSQPTLRGYLQQYKNGGIEALKEIKFYRPQSALEEYKGSIEEDFRQNPPATIKEATARIKELTGIERSEQRVGKFIKKNRFKAYKSGANTGQSGCEGAS
jgi:transposase